MKLITIFLLYVYLRVIGSEITNNVTQSASDTKAWFETIDTSYDFIVVGAGSSGAVIANRLSEIAEWSVLLVEAGEEPNPISEVPILTPMIQSDTNSNWDFMMEQEDSSCRGMPDQKCPALTGKALGGSSAIDSMIHSRGSPADFARWEALGNPGWSYEDVLPYFMKSEDCNLGNECFADYHRIGGYQSVSYSYSSEMAEAFFRAAHEMGYNLTEYSSPDTIGFSKIQARMKNGRRQSTYKSFLEPLRFRRNLQIVDDATVTKILIDRRTNSANGVEISKRINRYTIRANKEVIISAGTFNSAKLLMLSGIGPQQHLRELGILPIKDLPVGENFHDHITFPRMVYRMNEPSESRYTIFDPRDAFEYFFSGKGRYTSLGNMEGIAFVTVNSTEYSDEEKEVQAEVPQPEEETSSMYPNIQLIFCGIGSCEFNRGFTGVPLTSENSGPLDFLFKPIQLEPIWSIFPTLLHPKSKGKVQLRTNDFRDPPLIYGSYFSDENNEDLETMLSAIRMIQKLVITRPFEKYNSTLVNSSIPDCEVFEFDTDNYWKCALRSFSVGMFLDQTGTCKMGPVTDETSVVDHLFRVHGIENLRVADKSVIPVTMSGQTTSTAIMLGERVSDMIKEYWYFRREQ